MKKLKVSTLIENLMSALECNQKDIAHYSGLNVSSISTNLKKDLEDISNTKTGKRLFSLFVCVDVLSIKGVSAEGIIQSLNEYVFPDMENNYDSVITALNQDKYPPAVLKNIAQLGYQKFQEKLAVREPIKEQIYEVFHFTAVSAG